MIRNLRFHPHVGQLEFLPEPHIYTVRERADPLPSITGILKAEGINSYAESANAQWAMQIGTWVHQAIAWLEEGTLDEATTSDGVLAYLNSYQAWKHAIGFEPYIVEEPMWHNLWNYAGTPDLIGKVAGFWHVVELKTGSPRAGDKVQVGAQAELVGNCVVGLRREFFRGEVLYLNDKGGYPRVEVIEAKEVRENSDLFYAALRINRWKKINGGKGNG